MECFKNKIKKEGSELTTNCSQLKMQSIDGKYYNTDVMDIEQILRLIQSIPSKKAEPLKLWLAQVGKERIDEAYDPEIKYSNTGLEWLFCKRIQKFKRIKKGKYIEFISLSMSAK